MTEINETVGHFKGLYTEAEDRLPGASVAWVARRRQAAINRFAEQGMPAPRDEEWKYTSLRPIEKRAFALPEPDAHEVSLTDIDPYVFDEPTAHRLVFVDGAYSERLSQASALPQGVTAHPLSQALDAGDEALSHHLGHYADPEGTPFVALNTALMSDGVYLHVPAGVTVATPIHVLFVASAGAEERVLSYRNVLVAGEGASATVLESYVGLAEGAYLTNTVTEAVAPEGARLAVYKLQEEATSGYHIAAFEAYQGGASEVYHHNMSLGARLARNDINDALDHEGAHVGLNGLYLGDGRQHVDNHTRIDHLQPRTTSQEYYKGILDGRSRGVFNGKVVVQPQAQETSSDQQNRNLLLSRNAEVDPKPELEIFADDVSCTHGATIGQLDEDALFFLQTRGMAYAEARSLLIFGFANEIIEGIPIEQVRYRLEDRLMRRLPHAEAMEE
ncbi:Fe-S cluster assembly protein SufD [Thiohalorhabdus sp.]|uniref:Fe-S cluster assembly protein SufD n=1 Tax=Thiohalorhabdus sp. TaxID=3094134 RepID=UPI002FC359EB